jgi:hypothetical protein
MLQSLLRRAPALGPPALPPWRLTAGRLARCAVACLGVACGSPDGLPEYCAERADDGDCDGTPDSLDQCPGSELEQLTDARGCTSNQRAGCSVVLKTPTEGERLDAEREVVYRWTGDCDIYLVQLSNDPSFPPGATSTVARAVELQAEADGGGAYWRVVGGLYGRPDGYATPAREVRWK